jgi:uncharacterized protein (DUF58 family)
MLTHRTIKFIVLFSSVLIAGLILGNLIIILMSLLPLCLLALALSINSPGNIEAKTQNLITRVWVGDQIVINYEIEVKSGLGCFSVYQEIPPYFSLIEGNNYRVFWKSWKPRKFVYRYKICCTKRGLYKILPIKWEANHPLHLKNPASGLLGEITDLVVRPKILNIRRIRGIPGIAASPFPVIDTAKLGVVTTDFREIRNYVYGDSIKNINWKATARNTNPLSRPLVNEYEVEGKKAVWIFLDASGIIEVGTDIENAFEYCLEAANSVLYYFIDRGYRVGMYVFNSDEKLYYPDAGNKQFLKISRDMIGLKTTRKYDEFPIAVEKCRRYILGYNPLCVVITGLDNSHSGNIVTGTRKLKVLRGRQKRKLPVMVINIPGYNIMPVRNEYDINNPVVMKLTTRPRIQQIRRLGASVLDWNPRKEGFGTALLKLLKVQ